MLIYFGNRNSVAKTENALLAQLDRVFGYEPKGQGFESLAARQLKDIATAMSFNFLSKGFEPTSPKANIIGCLRSKRWAEPIESLALRQK